MGRSITYDPAIADAILIELSEGKGLNTICNEHAAFPAESTVRGWVVDDYEGFAAKYARARDIGLDCAAERVRAMPRGVAPEDVPRARLEFDAERWYLSKIAPKRYGEKIQNEVVGAGGGPITLNIVPVKTDDKTW